MTKHASFDTIVPRSIHPTGKGNITFLLIMIANAQLSPQKKTIRRNSPSWTSSTTQLTFLACLHHLCFLPTILLTRHVRINSRKLKKTPHTRNIANIIPTILSKTSPRCQQLKRQSSSRHSVSFFAQHFREQTLNMFHYALIRCVGWRKNERTPNPIPRENRSSLRSGHSDNNHRLRLRQTFRNLEAKPAKPLLKKLIIQQSLIALFIYLFLQQTQMLDRNHSRLITKISQTLEQFINKPIHDKRSHVNHI